MRLSDGDRDTKRLKGLDEFTPPSFVGRMDRTRRRRRRAFQAALAIAVVVGAGIGLLII